MSNPVPPPVAPKGDQTKTNRVLGVVLIVGGALFAILGFIQVVGADTPYDAGRNMGRVTMGLLAAAAGAYIVYKNKP